MMIGIADRVEEAARFIRKSVPGLCPGRPRAAIILGTGLGALAKEIKRPRTIPYSDIPFFPAAATTIGHEGKLVMGLIRGKPVVAMQGRFHYYEGYSMQDITLPTRVMARLGARVLVVSNAAGGMNPQFELGDLMVITDHINLMGDNPLIGLHDERLGDRFPDMSEPYDRKLIALAEDVASAQRVRLKRGVYVGVSGPNLETAAEYRFLRLIGSDAVGMSTVPETIVARQAGMRVLGLSCITDRCLPDALEPADIQRILKIAGRAEPVLSCLVKEIVGRL